MVSTKSYYSLFFPFLKKKGMQDEKINFRDNLAFGSTKAADISDPKQNERCLAGS